MNIEKKDKVISSTVTAVSMAVLFLFLFFSGLKYQVPPPEPKKVLMIELTMGGGGGGGVEAPTKSRTQHTASENIQTQNAVDAPVVNSSPNPKKTDNAPAVQEPTVDQSATYRPGRGGGSGGGSGTGRGSGIGSGMGPGEGSGSGGGIGYGIGNRGYTFMPNLTVAETGTVYVEVHVDAAGNVVEARIINNAKYPTTITNAEIRSQCVAKAKTAKYKKGKEELRIIVFK